MKIAVKRADAKPRLGQSWGDNIRKHYQLYLMSIPTLVFFIIFLYFPMYGVQIAFKNYMPSKSIWGSSWVGFEHFLRFFRSYNFIGLLKNTLGLSIYQLAANFPLPIILALMLNEVRNKTFRKSVQMVTYAPHFISTVVLVGMLTVFLSPQSGIVNQAIKMLGGEPVAFLSKPEYFKTIYVLSGLWQSAGWNSIIYIAALSGIDPQLHEAATVDGASKVKRIWHIDIPGIMPTMIIMLIMNTGSIMNIGFEKVFLMQNDLNIVSSDVISTYVYRVGLVGGEYSFSAAVGLFNSVVNCILLVTVNAISRRVSETSLW